MSATRTTTRPGLGAAPLPATAGEEPMLPAWQVTVVSLAFGAVAILVLLFG